MSARLRVLRVITRLNVGGPTRHLRLIMEGLERKGVEELLISGPCGPQEGRGVLKLPTQQLLLPELRREIHPWRDLQALKALRQIIASFKPHLVHTHQGKAGILGRAAAHRAGIPALHTYHGHTLVDYFGPLKSRLLLSAERWAARRSALLICQSPSQEQDLLSLLGPAARGRTRVLFPALDPETLAPPESGSWLRRKWGVDTKRRVVLFCGRLVPIKRPRAALATFACLAQEVDGELWFAGEGPLLPGLKRETARLGLEARVRFLPFRERIGPLYQAADVLFLSSLQEGTPLVLIEAMAAGLPVVATNVGGVKDILGQAGWVLEPAWDEASWSQALRAALTSRAARAACREAGLARVAERFQPEQLLEGLLALYRDLTPREAKETWQ